MFEMGALRKRPTAPDARDFRYRMLRPFKRALAKTSIERNEVESIVQSAGGQLRLDVRDNAVVVIADEA